MPLRELISQISHHYATDAAARRNVAHNLDLGLFPGLVLRREGKMILVEREEKS